MFVCMSLTVNTMRRDFAAVMGQVPPVVSTIEVTAQKKWTVSATIRVPAVRLPAQLPPRVFPVSRLRSPVSGLPSPVSRLRSPVSLPYFPSRNPAAYNNASAVFASWISPRSISESASDIGTGLSSMNSSGSR